LAEASQKPDESKWIVLKKIAYKDASGKDRIWETAERTVFQHNAVDAVYS